MDVGNSALVKWIYLHVSATNQVEKPEIKPEVCFADVNDGKKVIIVNLKKTSGLNPQPESSELLFMW